MKETPFIIKSYHKADLALMYHPGLTVAAAMNKMRRWINRNTELKRRMKAVRTSPQNHTYAPVEVAILVKFLGEP